MKRKRNLSVLIFLCSLSFARAEEDYKAPYQVKKDDTLSEVLYQWTRGTGVWLYSQDGPVEKSKKENSHVTDWKKLEIGEDIILVMPKSLAPIPVEENEREVVKKEEKRQSPVKKAKVAKELSPSKKTLSLWSFEAGPLWYYGKITETNVSAHARFKKFYNIGGFLGAHYRYNDWSFENNLDFLYISSDLPFNFPLDIRFRHTLSWYQLEFFGILPQILIGYDKVSMLSSLRDEVNLASLRGPYSGLQLRYDLKYVSFFGAGLFKFAHTSEDAFANERDGLKGFGFEAKLRFHLDKFKPKFLNGLYTDLSYHSSEVKSGDYKVDDEYYLLKFGIRI